MSEDWAREMVEVEQEISRAQEGLRRLWDRRERLRRVLDGPSVVPVLVKMTHGHAEEIHYDGTLVEAVQYAQGVAEDGLAWVRSVSVGGAVLTDDEREAIIEGSGWS